jgi:hypothetical protein
MILGALLALVIAPIALAAGLVQYLRGRSFSPPYPYCSHVSGASMPEMSWFSRTMYSCFGIARSND